MHKHILNKAGTLVLTTDPATNTQSLSLEANGMVLSLDLESYLTPKRLKEIAKEIKSPSKIKGLKFKQLTPQIQAELLRQAANEDEESEIAQAFDRVLHEKGIRPDHTSYDIDGRCSFRINAKKLNHHSNLVVDVVIGPDYTEVRHKDRPLNANEAMDNFLTDIRTTWTAQSKDVIKKNCKRLRNSMKRLRFSPEGRIL